MGEVVFWPWCHPAAPVHGLAVSRTRNMCAWILLSVWGLHQQFLDPSGARAMFYGVRRGGAPRSQRSQDQRLCCGRTARYGASLRSKLTLQMPSTLLVRFSLRLPLFLSKGRCIFPPPPQALSWRLPRLLFSSSAFGRWKNVFKMCTNLSHVL